MENIDENAASMESIRQKTQQELAMQRVLCRILLTAALLLFGNSSQAQDRAQESISSTNKANLCRFAVALPEMEGPLTLGIFSEDGTLIRPLYRETPIDAIPAGLNGLLLSWDGKDDSGVEVPEGIYHARGLVHGKLAHSEIPWNDPDWHGSRLLETNEPSIFPMTKLMLPEVRSNRIVVRAAPDALFQDGSRPSLAIMAQLQSNSIIVSAEGLPLTTIPLEGWNAETKPEVELHHGIRPGTAEITVISGDARVSFLLIGLDHLVPLDVGALPMSPGRN
jgi:hypothetical protein